MDVIAYLRILRRRWLLVVLPCVGAALAAGLTLPDQQRQAPVAATYRSTVTLITPAFSADSSGSVNLAMVALYATTGDIPERAAKLLDYEGEPQILAAMITVTPHAETGTLTMSTTHPDGEAAANRVNRFAEATISYFRDQQLAEDRVRIRELDRELSRITSELQKLQSGESDGNKSVTEARVSALQTQYATLYNEQNMLASSAGKTEALTVLERGVPIPLGAPGFVAPTNPLTRVGIAGLLGLLLGASLALVVERFDSRMRTREQVEDAIGLPVLAEIPVLPRRDRAEVVSASRPASVAAEAFRTLRSALLLMTPGLPSRHPGGREQRGWVVLVTSALPDEGKTTTAANLAAVMAEAGRSVLILSLDLRNPRIHEYFGVANGTGVSDLLAADRGRHLKQVVRETGVGGVSIATSGHDMEHPGALLASVGPLVAAARLLADVVIIDSPPMLTVADTSDIVGESDVTLLVSRLNKSTRAQAAECQRLLARLGVSALGTVLVGSKPAGARYGYPLTTPRGVRADDEEVAFPTEERETS